MFIRAILVSKERRNFNPITISFSLLFIIKAITYTQSQSSILAYWFRLGPSWPIQNIILIGKTKEKCRLCTNIDKRTLYMSRCLLSISLANCHSNDTH